MMRIVVCLKQIPDPQAPAGSFYVDEASGQPGWSPPAEAVISTFDLHAVEAAARLKEENGATVTLISLGPPESEVALRRALAAGADDAVRIDPAAAPDGDRAAVARALAAAILKAGAPDLVLCGRIAADWDAGHVPMMLAERLGLPGVTPVLDLQYAAGTFTVQRLTDAGQETVQVDAPCVLAVSNEVNDPRYPTMRSVLAAQRAPIIEWTPAALGLEGSGHDDGALLERVYRLDLGTACEFVEAGSPEEAGTALADLLAEVAFG